MHPYLYPLRQGYEEAANPEQAEQMAAYLKNQFAFYGIKMGPRRAVVKEFVAEHGLPEPHQLDAVIHDAWEQPQREWQYFAQDTLEKFIRKAPAELIDLLEWMIVHKSWWDTVDHIATKLVGGLVKRYPALIESHLERWIASDNMWLQRSCLLFQLKYKADTDLVLLDRYIQACLGSREFFINKAIGWVLREYSKTDAEWVRDYVAKHEAELAPLSKKEALKRIS